MAAKPIISAILFIVIAFGFPVDAIADLVAHYPMNEGIGNTVFDVSGNENHGTITDGVWTFGAFGAALRFDGNADGHINCGNAASLSIGECGSIQVWFKPEAPMQGGLVCWGLGGSWEEQRFTTLINQYGNYDEFGVYIADGESYFRPYRGVLPPVDEWTCLCVTFTKRSIDIFLDGVLVKTAFQQVMPGIEGFDLLIGKAFGWVQYGLFRGVLDEVRVYDHCLSSQEVFQLYKAEAVNRGKETSGFGTIRITPEAHPKPGTITARLDYRGLAPISQDATIEAKIVKAVTGGASGGSISANSMSSAEQGRHKAELPGAQHGSGQPLQGEVRLLPMWGEALARFDVRNHSPGTYILCARAYVQGVQIGRTAETEVYWPGRDSAWQGIEVLNNLCWELLDEAPGASWETQYTCSHPRDGWVYFRTQATGNLDISATDANPSLLHDPAGPENQECMRWIEAGALQIDVTGTGSLDRLIVKAVPALVFTHWPLVKTGLESVEDHPFLAEHVLPQANTIMDHGHCWYTDEWVNQEGGHWRSVVYKPLAEASGTTQGIYDYLTSMDGLTHPDLHGVQLDEFYPGVPYLAEWTDACAAILDDPMYDGHMIIPYFGGNVWDHADCTAFLQAVASRGSWLAYMAYYPELASEERAWFSVYRDLSRTVNSMEQIIPGVTGQLQIVFSHITEFTGENADVQASLKRFMDLQYHQLATQPEFFGIPAIEQYVSHHSDEESIRWAARLFRHYALEGHRDPMCEDPYALDHLANGDFLDGIQGWTAIAAEPDSMDVKRFRGLGILQHRRSHGYGTEVPFLRTRRSSINPNRISQTLAGLEPGRLYSLKLITGDYQDLLLGVSAEKQHAISIDIQGADLLSGPQYLFQHRDKSKGTLGVFNWENPYWMNLHCRVFRALGMDVTVTISDWVSPSSPGGAYGQELFFDHIEVQPYFESGE